MTSPPAAVRTWPERIAVGLLLLAMFLQCVLSMRLLTATIDETTHLPSGYTYLKTGDFRMNPQHPPLVKLLAAAPLVFLDPTLNLEDRAWKSAGEWEFGYRFLYSNDADRLLFWGRMPVVLLSLLLAFYVYRWGRELFGATSGLTALLLCAFSPTVIAHARFVTFDVGLACFSTVALFHLWRHLRQGGRADLILAGLGLGAALASKFSAAVLPPLFVLFVVWDALQEAERPMAVRARKALITLSVSALLAALVIQGSYFFSGDPLIYWKGVTQVNRDHVAEYPYYLMGQFKPGGFAHYFLAAFFLKTPAPTLILLVLSLAWLRRFRAPRFLDEAFLVLPVLAYTVMTSALADNLGIRYLLPVYPLVFIFVSRLARGISGSRAVQVGALVLAVWYTVGTVRIYPDYLAYFSDLVGGAKHGHLYLDDSNIDWGQDLKRLKRYMDEEGIESIKLKYGKFGQPAYYGIQAEEILDRDWAGDPSPGFYAFGTHYLVRGEYYARERGLKTDWITRYEPVARIGYSLWVFKIEP